MTMSRSSNDSAARRAFPVVDRFLVAAILLELLCTALVPALPFAVFALAFLTPLRRSRSRMLVLGILAAALTLLVVIPIIVTRLGVAQIVQQGPVHRVHQ
ncbi:MAG: hypothetical protein V4479_03190 [Actinomycetota bacterium]